MTWLLVGAVWLGLYAVYAIGHELGYRKGRREAWAPVVTLHANDVARLHRRVQEREEPK